MRSSARLNEFSADILRRAIFEKVTDGVLSYDDGYGGIGSAKALAWGALRLFRLACLSSAARCRFHFSCWSFWL